MGIRSMGMLVNVTRLVYDGFVFSTEWCVFLVLIVALVQAAVAIINRARDALILCVVLFLGNLTLKYFTCQDDECYGEYGIFYHGARVLFDAFMFAIETSIFIALALAVYSLAQVLFSHMRNAMIMWLILFVVYVILKSTFSLTAQIYDDDWH
ncbi:hypothetical protein Ocin01_01673 [Orchesella cincta]|uniref:Transmembrane protein n=1 Tax=Orchesella cincta TaxID=48709 RepID=A0A1D2NJ84_ORCCI|nr:hypothetical protein Ocin01_01673 [Orchesella cincta]